jgi:TRAP-type transport system periplasmic protein
MMRQTIFAAALVAGLAMAGAGRAEEVLRATSMLPLGTVYSQSFVSFIERVNAEAAGVLRIDLLGGPEALPTAEQANAVRNGIVDMIYGPSSYYPGDVPETDAFVGGNVSPAELRTNGGMALLNEIHQQKLNAYLLSHPEGSLGFHIYLSQAPVLDAAGLPDLEGLRIRGAQLYREFFTGLGATYVSIKVPEVYTALERGTVAGVGWPSVGLMDLSWDNFLTHRIDPRYFQGDIVILVNFDRWQSMDDSARNALQAFGLDHEQRSYDIFAGLAIDEDAEMRKRGIEVVTLSDSAAREYRRRAYDTAWERLKSRDDSHYDALRQLFYVEE